LSKWYHKEEKGGKRKQNLQKKGERGGDIICISYTAGRRRKKGKEERRGRRSMQSTSTESRRKGGNGLKKGRRTRESSARINLFFIWGGGKGIRFSYHLPSIPRKKRKKVEGKTLQREGKEGNRPILSSFPPREKEKKKKGGKERLQVMDVPQELKEKREERHESPWGKKEKRKKVKKLLFSEKERGKGMGRGLQSLQRSAPAQKKRGKRKEGGNCILP